MDEHRRRLVELITDALVEFDRDQYEGYTGEPWTGKQNRLSKVARVNDAQYAAHAVLQAGWIPTVTVEIQPSPPGCWGHITVNSDGTTSTEWVPDRPEVPETYGAEAEALVLLRYVKWRATRIHQCALCGRDIPKGSDYLKFNVYPHAGHHGHLEVGLGTGWRQHGLTKSACSGVGPDGH